MAEEEVLKDYQEEFLDERRVQSKKESSGGAESPMSLRDMIKDNKEQIDSLKLEFNGLQQSQTSISVDIDGINNVFDKRITKIENRLDEFADIIVRDQANKSVSGYSMSPVIESGISDEELLKFINPHVRLQQDAARTIDSEHAAMIIPEQLVKVKISDLQQVTDALRARGVEIKQIFMSGSNKHTP